MNTNNIKKKNEHIIIRSATNRSCCTRAQKIRTITYIRIKADLKKIVYFATIHIIMYYNTHHSVVEYLFDFQ